MSKIANIKVIDFTGHTFDSVCGNKDECKESLYCIQGTCQCLEYQFWDKGRCVQSKFSRINKFVLQNSL